jgi:hypothetical protein
VFFSLNSGLARTFGRAAFARPSSVARRALQPTKLNGLPSLARFASTEAGSVGKIHQVIGAVVDGMFLESRSIPARWRLRENLFYYRFHRNNHQQQPNTCLKPRYLTWNYSEVRW